MNEKVEEFLREKNRAKREAYEKQKEKTLIDLGLYEREYSDSDYPSEEYPFAEWDEFLHENRYYKIVNLDVSDEDYEKILKSTRIPVKASVNNVAVALKVVAGLIFLAGFILGIVGGNEAGEVASYFSADEPEFSFTVALVYWGVTLLGGMFFLALGEITDILHEIKNKMMNSNI